MSQQSAVLGPLPAHARYLTFGLAPDATAEDLRSQLASLTIDDTCVVGLGAPLVKRLGLVVEYLRVFPVLPAALVEVPSTQASLWVWLRGDDRGELLNRGRAVIAALPALSLREAVDGFVHAGGRDLTGYEDGTENPSGDEAVAHTFIEGETFVAVQRWVSELDRFGTFSAEDRDHIIGRRIRDNEEIDDAPPSAHVKRTAQETFEPEAWMMRRSMPWSQGTEAGLMFVAFAKSFDPFEQQLTRMVGIEDGVVDALFRFTRPVTGSYFWCPPCRDGRLDLGG